MPAYQDVYRRSIEDPEGFWLDAARLVDWDVAPTAALDGSHAPFFRWFPDARLNTCHNALDRWVDAGHGDRVALVYDSPVTSTVQSFTYGELRDEVARFVSYVPQAHATFFPFTVREVVLMGRTAHLGVFSSPTRRDRELAQAAIDRMRLGSLADAVYTRISGGERQLVLIARALAQDARIIVMDEPTANLDFGNQVRVIEHIRSLAGAGMGVLLSTHDPDQAFVCADRVAMLHEGRLARAGTPAETITAESLRQIYGVGVVVMDVTLPGGATRPVCMPAGAD